MSRRHEIPEEERVYIAEAAELLDRRIGTLRKWEANGILPLHLRPERGKRRWRYWTPTQIDGIKEWIRKTDRRPGRGIPHVDERNADPEMVRKQIHAMRKPRGKKS
jgi:phage terminase Nu1 subunit (DNA packaging protein)